MSDLIDIYLREELKIANKHLPREQISICDLMTMDIPYVITHDGSLHVIDPRELQILYKISGGDCALKLPVIIEYIPQGQGIYVIRDDKGAFVVSKVLNIESRTPLILHRVQVLELRRNLRTTTTILLSPGVLD